MNVWGNSKESASLDSLPADQGFCHHDHGSDSSASLIAGKAKSLNRKSERSENLEAASS